MAAPMLPNSMPTEPIMNSHTPAGFSDSHRKNTLPTTKVVLPSSPMAR